MHSEIGNVLDADDVARIFKMKPRTVQRLAKQGKIRGEKMGRRWYFREQDILKKWAETSNDKESAAGATGT